MSGKEMKKTIDKKHRNDIIMALSLLAIACIAFAVIELNKKEGGYAVVIQDGREIASYPLDEDIIKDFPSETGRYNKLVIKDGYADITEASCPDKLCVHQNKIRYSNETIVCLPNKLVVKIVSDDESDVDVIA